MRERDRCMGELMGKRRRETEKEGEIERERRVRETDVSKLYTYNEYEHSVYKQFGYQSTKHSTFNTPILSSSFVLTSYEPIQEFF